MDLSIRDYIKSNFKESSNEEIIESIESSIKEKEEETLPGLGVFFEFLWEQSSKEEKEKIVNNISKKLK